MVDNTFLFHYVHVVLKLFFNYYLYSSNLVYVITIVIVIGSLNNQVGNCICEKVSEKVWDQFVADRMQVVALSQKKKQQHNCPSIQSEKEEKEHHAFGGNETSQKKFFLASFIWCEKWVRGESFDLELSVKKCLSITEKKWLNKNTYMYVRTENL